MSVPLCAGTAVAWLSRSRGCVLELVDARVRGGGRPARRGPAGVALLSEVARPGLAGLPPVDVRRIGVGRRIVPGPEDGVRVVGQDAGQLLLSVRRAGLALSLGKQPGQRDWLAGLILDGRHMVLAQVADVGAQDG